jgi:acetyl-CoA acetyltransferase
MPVSGGILRDLEGSEIPPKAPPNLLAQTMCIGGGQGISAVVERIKA